MREPTHWPMNEGPKYTEVTREQAEMTRPWIPKPWELEEDNG